MEALARSQSTPSLTVTAAARWLSLTHSLSVVLSNKRTNERTKHRTKHRTNDERRMNDNAKFEFVVRRSSSFVVLRPSSFVVLRRPLSFVVLCRRSLLFGRCLVVPLVAVHCSLFVRWLFVVRCCRSTVLGCALLCCTCSLGLQRRQ